MLDKSDWPGGKPPPWMTEAKEANRPGPINRIKTATEQEKIQMANVFSQKSRQVWTIGGIVLVLYLLGSKR